MNQANRRWLTITLFLLSFIHLKGQGIIDNTVWFCDIIQTKDSSFLFPHEETRIVFTTDDSGIRRTVKRAIKRQAPLLVSYDDNFRILEVSEPNILDVDRLAYFMPRREINPSFGFKRNLRVYKKKNAVKKSYYDSLHQTISPDSLAIIFQDVLDHSCDSNLDCSCETPCITTQFKLNGCFARAHQIRKLVEVEHGYLTQKIYARSITQEGHKLIALNDGNCGRYTIDWNWHVASCITQKDSDGKEVKFVLDPSLDNKPVNIDEWLKLIQYDKGKVAEWLCVKSEYYGLKKVSSLSTKGMTIDHTYFKTRAFLSQHCRFCDQKRSLRAHVYKSRYRKECETERKNWETDRRNK